MAQRTEPRHDNQVELKEHRENIFRVNHAHVLHKNIKCKSYRFATDTSFAWMRKRVLCALQLNVRARALLHIIPSIKMPLAPRVLFHKRSGHPQSICATSIFAQLCRPPQCFRTIRAHVRGPPPEHRITTRGGVWRDDARMPPQ